MRLVEDDDLTVTTEDEIEEVTNEEEEAIESSDVSEENEPETIQDEEEDEEDRIVTIGDVPSEEAEGNEEEADKPETPGWVKKVRKVNRKLESENKRLKRQLEQKETETVKPVELGEKPTLASSKYDEEKFANDLEAYNNRKRKVETQAAERTKLAEKQNESWQNQQKKYVAKKEEHAFKDYADVEELVSNTFSDTQQGIIVQGAEDAALVVYALGKNPKKLEELAKINDPVEFAVKIGKLESQLKITSRKAPKPEKRIKGGKSGGMSGNSDKNLEQLRVKAEKSGDYSEVRAYKQKLRNKDS